MATLATRRQVLRWGLCGGVAVVLPSSMLACGEDDASLGPGAPTPTAPPSATPAPSFLTSDELGVVRAVAALVVPTDSLPGAVEAGAVQYIDRLLAVVPDAHAPAAMVFAGGPFSGRNPFPDPSTGVSSNSFPADDFANFIPLTRLQLLSWRVRLLGTAAVPGSDFNSAVLGPVIGWRDQYRTGIAALQSKSTEMFAADFLALTADQQDQVLATAGAFRDLITAHTLEGMFSAPEYGGNTNAVGWHLIRYDGDSQPLGYSIFDQTTTSYRERADKPNSSADPDEDFSGVDAATQQTLAALVRAVGGPHFP